MPFSEPLQHVVFLIAIAIAAIGASLDWRKGEIPNWLTLPTILAAPIFHLIRYKLAKETMEAASYEAAYSIGGAALSAVVPLILFGSPPSAAGRKSWMAMMTPTSMPTMPQRTVAKAKFLTMVLS